MVYLAELLNQHTTSRLGYAHDVALHRAIYCLFEDLERLATDVSAIPEGKGGWKKVTFGPEKFDIVRLRERNACYTLPILGNQNLILDPIQAESPEQKAMLCWLAMFFHRKLTRRSRVLARVAKARAVAQQARIGTSSVISKLTW